MYSPQLKMFEKHMYMYMYMGTRNGIMDKNNEISLTRSLFSDLY